MVRISISAVLGGLFVHAALAAPLRYEITPLGPANAMSGVACVNERGVMLGSIYQPGDGLERMVLFSHHKKVSSLTGRKTSRNDFQGLNDHGVVVGSLKYQGHFLRAAILRGHGLPPLSVASLLAPGSGWNDLESAQAINKVGQIVGTGINTAGEYRAFIYDHGVATDLGALGSGDRRFSQAFAINELGQVVGISTTSSTSHWHGFVYANGTMTDIGALVPGGNCYPTAINDFGQIAGYSSSIRKFHAFLYSNGVMTDLGTLKSGRPSFARALNATGQVVGDAIVHGSETYHGWIYTKGKMTDLNRLVPKDSRWEIISALDINNAGVIAANGRDAAGRYRALRLTPVIMR